VATSTRSDTYRRIYRVVRRIPRGRVATYGQVAELAGFPRHARMVGYALHALEDDAIPWQRVINARGQISPRAWPGAEVAQRRLLEEEGVRFDRDGRIELTRFVWRPRIRRPEPAQAATRRRA
jgi:methylated-DNA-protein-cysteine methyltransferase-like protein